MKTEWCSQYTTHTMKRVHSKSERAQRKGKLCMRLSFVQQLSVEEEEEEEGKKNIQRLVVVQRTR